LLGECAEGDKPRNSGCAATDSAECLAIKNTRRVLSDISQGARVDLSDDTCSHHPLCTARAGDC